jgi:uncharacterized membrane protein YsdA (DUF1294 family)
MGLNGYNARAILVHGALALGMAGLAAVGLWWGLGRRSAWPHGLGCWLVAVNVVAFGTYGYDKAQATASRARVPEMVLLLVTVVGGGLGSFAGSYWFRRQTAGGFRFLMWGMAALQATLVVWLIWIMW